MITSQNIGKLLEIIKNSKKNESLFFSTGEIKILKLISTEIIINMITDII